LVRVRRRLTIKVPPRYECEYVRVRRIRRDDRRSTCKTDWSFPIATAPQVTRLDEATSLQRDAREVFREILLVTTPSHLRSFTVRGEPRGGLYPRQPLTHISPQEWPTPVKARASNSRRSAKLPPTASSCLGESRIEFPARNSSPLVWRRCRPTGVAESGVVARAAPQT
jgi:hypothetical protein